MSEPKNVDKILTAKRELEYEISDLITVFQENNGVNLSSIRLDPIKKFGVYLNTPLIKIEIIL